MNWVDLIIILAVAAFALEGQKRGFVVQAIDIIGFLASLVGSLILYQSVASVLVKVFSLPQIAALPIGFLLVWIVVESIFFILFDRHLKRYVVPHLSGKINNYLGFAPAAVNALLFMAFVLLFAVSLPIKGDIKQEIYNAKIGSYLVDKATVLERPLNNIFGPIAKQSLTFLTVNPEDKTSVNLGYTQNALTADYESEQKMLELVNTERRKAGRKPVAWDENLAKVGRSHSRDMFERGYFSHYSPESRDVGNRLEENKITYAIAGENLALAPNVNRAHTGLMNSEGHKRNILDPAFKKIGIGAIDGGVYGKMFTQVFTD